MKVGIIGCANLRQMPYARSYIDLLTRNNIESELIMWDRFGLTEFCPIPAHIYNEPLEDSAPKVRKIRPMLRYRAFVRRQLQRGRYSFLIVLTTIPAVLLVDVLQEFHGRYAIDIRDYTFEHFMPYRIVLHRALSNAALRIVSSPAFCSALPKGRYYTFHNVSPELRNRTSVPPALLSNQQAIRINYIGAISYVGQVLKLFQRVGNDPRYVIGIHGAGPVEAELKRVAADSRYANIAFTGAYLPDEKETYLLQSDVIFNAYGSDSHTVRLALSNKLYDAAWYYKLILVTPNTAMAEASRGFGITIDLDDPLFGDKLWNHFTSLDRPQFYKTCDSFMSRVKLENEETERVILKGIKQHKG